MKDVQNCSNLNKRCEELLKFISYPNWMNSFLNSSNLDDSCSEMAQFDEKSVNLLKFEIKI